MVSNRVETEGSGDVMDANGNPERSQNASWVGALDMIGNIWKWTRHATVMLIIRMRLMPCRIYSHIPIKRMMVARRMKR